VTVPPDIHSLTSETGKCSEVPIKGTMLGWRRHRHMMSSCRYACNTSAFSTSAEERGPNTHPSDIVDLISMQPQSFHSYSSSLQYGAPDIRERSLRERSGRIQDHSHWYFAGSGCQTRLSAKAPQATNTLGVRCV
jgi:hypothetical protein